MQAPPPRPTSRIPTWSACAALLFASTSGCLIHDPASEAGSPGSPQVPPPAWRAGDRWNYTIYGPNGSTRGYASYEVLGTTTVENATAYRVREVSVAPEVSNHSRVRVISFDARTLNRVWDHCGEDPRQRPNCQGRSHELDFPLRDGKAWGPSLGGDVVISYNATAIHVPDVTLPEAAGGGLGELWQIEIRPFRTGEFGARIILVYAPTIGLVTERTVEDPISGEDSERWVLKSTNREPVQRAPL